MYTYTDISNYRVIREDQITYCGIHSDRRSEQKKIKVHDCRRYFWFFQKEIHTYSCQFWEYLQVYIRLPVMNTSSHEKEGDRVNGQSSSEDTHTLTFQYFPFSSIFSDKTSMASKDKVKQSRPHNAS